ncbi:T9SS type A sorting domain-containing protein [Hymenobacter negativus]|uniref:T9SS type A sorting domain-containing protein n=1 Tax=Hymenobacter negativus TaxID=2795026 RepID=A0ABS0Q7C7_9BACT|nr:T9SS type A sorting domain-containing protein [Hymenobacter negativus]MBH8558490.1 T9SS type A sorting domain-containing protein [Hymenobacter negativus]
MTASTDILIIQGGTSASPKIVSVNFGSTGTTSSQSIGRLILRGYTELHVPTANSSATIKNLTITGSGQLAGAAPDETTTAIDDLVAESGSSVQVIGDGANGNNNTRSNLNFILGTNSGPFPNATGYFAGALTFTNATSSNGNGLVTHTIQGATAGTVRFVNGSTFTIAYAGSGDSYTGASVSGPNGLVTFESGSFMDQRTASDNYGPVLFQAGSTYQYYGGTFGPLTTDRTYGNLTFANNATNATLAGGFYLTILNSLSKIAGSTSVVNISTAYTLIGGDIINYAGTLNFVPNVGGAVTFNGTTPQAISGSFAPVFGANAAVTMNNAQGLTLNLPVTIANSLNLTNGLINTTGTTVLTLPAAASIGGGSSTSYVNGPVARTTVAGASTNMVFPVGKSGNYRPITLNITAQGNAVTYTGEQIETPPAQTVSSPLTRVSFRRAFTLVPSVAPTAFSATVTLSFGTDDFANYPADASFVMARRDGANPWVSIGRSANTGTATNGAPVVGTLTSAAFTTFPTTISGYSLASTSPAAVGAYPGLNPLPVELSRFDATAKGAGVALTWATASEKNSDRFEIQRSATGEVYETLGSVKGQGNTTLAHDYSFVDSHPLAGTAYYRLRQVDSDGTFSFSPVAAVQTEASTKVELYPNPSASQLILPAGVGVVQYRIFNALGQTLLSGKATDNDRLDITSLPKGPFFLEMSGATGRHTQRLMRE